VALVAGATRGAGRGIARMLGECGATVYCTGRGSRERPSSAGYCAGRPETIEETAEMVDAAGGTGIAARVDHGDEPQVAALFDRVRRDHGRLDVLVNNFWGGIAVEQWGEFWRQPMEQGRALFDAAWPHVLTCRHAVPLMIERRSGLIVQITEGDGLYYRMNLYYDLGRPAEIRLAYALAEELGPYGVTALALTPGYMRTEAMLDGFGVTEANWREGAKQDPNFLASESPCFVGRAVAALAADANVASKSGGLHRSWALAEEYGFNDLDGTRPNLAKHLGHNPGESPFGPPRSATAWKVMRARI
jgi:NAD(P)-dependent dehydrogenase (short-subunit alcohol dehydrogenase family)